MSKLAAGVFFGLCSMLLLPSHAQAYLDPGNGSMLLQLLLGGVAGLSVIVKLYWRRFLTALGLAKREEEPLPNEQLPTDASPDHRVNRS